MPRFKFMLEFLKIKKQQHKTNIKIVTLMDVMINKYLLETYGLCLLK